MMVSSRSTDFFGNLVEEIIDHGDGTATKTIYNLDGSTTVETLTGLEIFVPEVDVSEAITAAKTSLASATTIAQVRARTLTLFDLLNEG